MARHRRLGRVVVDTSVVIRAARAFRQQPPEPNTPELLLVLAWRDDPEVFTCSIAKRFSPSTARSCGVSKSREMRLGDSSICLLKAVRR
jgi:hypothetical protein